MSLIDRKHLGARSELIACSYLLSQGLEVFRNVSPHGDVDLIALDPNTKETTFIDVKTLRGFENKTINQLPVGIQKVGIKILAVDPETNTCKLF